MIAAVRVATRLHCRCALPVSGPFSPGPRQDGGQDLLILGGSPVRSRAMSFASTSDGWTPKALRHGGPCRSGNCQPARVDAGRTPTCLQAEGADTTTPLERLPGCMYSLQTWLTAPGREASLRSPRPAACPASAPRRGRSCWQPPTIDASGSSARYLGPDTREVCQRIRGAILLGARQDLTGRVAAALAEAGVRRLRAALLCAMGPMPGFRVPGALTLDRRPRHRPVDGCAPVDS